MNYTLSINLRLLTYSLILSQIPIFAKESKPNIVVVFTDDQGYEDLSCFGSKNIKTPNIDALAANGIKMTSFYVSASVSTPSRAAILTGKYHVNVNMSGHVGVLYPDTPTGISKDECTIPKVLKTAGYKSALIDKWHLGHTPDHLPTALGYDYYYGVPFSNSMWLPKGVDYAKDLKITNNQTLEQVKLAEGKRDKKFKNKVPLMRNTSVIEYPAVQSTLTERYFDEAIGFIKKSREQEKPFFVFIAPNMPHIPLFATQKFVDRNSTLYAAAVDEIDHNIGRLVSFLKENKLFEDTIIVFTSDNGPWLSQKKNGGSAYPLRNGKFTCFEGGHRVPCVLSYPGKIKEGFEFDGIVSSIDLLPTFAEIAGADIPEGIDGISQKKLFTRESKESARDVFLYYSRALKLCGIRYKDKKVLFQQHMPKEALEIEDARYATPPYPIEMFDMSKDIAEKKDISKENPELVKKLIAMAKELDSKRPKPAGDSQSEK